MDAATTSWGYRHPRLSTGARLAAGTLNLVQGIVLLSCGYRWWGLLLLAVAASIFWAAHVFAGRHAAARRGGRSWRAGPTG